MLAVSRNSTFCTRKKTLQKNSHMLKLLYPLHRHTRHLLPNHHPPLSLLYFKRNNEMKEMNTIIQ